MSNASPPSPASTIGHVLGAVCGLGALLAGIEAIVHHMPGVLGAALLVTGGLMPLLAFYSYRMRRAAWAFLTTMCGVFATCMLFGAPKVRSTTGIDLGVALLIPLVLLVATVLLASQHRAYTDS